MGYIKQKLKKTLETSLRHIDEPCPQPYLDLAEEMQVEIQYFKLQKT